MLHRSASGELANPKRLKRPAQTTISSPNDTSAPPLRVTLDAQAYPHILDQIVALAPYPSLLALRRVNTTLRARVDALLCSHLVVRDVVGKRFPGVFFYTLREYPDGWAEEPGHVIPGFAFYRGACEGAYTAMAMRLEQRVAEDELGFPPMYQGPLNLEDSPGTPPQDIRYFGPPRTEDETERAEWWCRQSCAGVRQLHLIGDVEHEIDQLATVLGKVDTLRCSAGIGTLSTLKLHIKAKHFVHSSNFLLHPTVLDEEEHRCTTMFPMTLQSIAPKAITLHLKLYEGYHHEGHMVMPSGNLPALHSLTVVLETSSWTHEPPNNIDNLLANSYELGVLIDVIDDVASRLHVTQLTVVGLNPSTAPALGIYVPSEETSDEESTSDASSSLEHTVDPGPYLEQQFLRHVETRVRNKGLSWGGLTLEERVEKALANVRFQTLEQWKAEVGDDWAFSVCRT